MQEGRGGSGVGGMGQNISGRRDLERGQSCVGEMETKTYNMIRNEDFSIMNQPSSELSDSDKFRTNIQLPHIMRPQQLSL